MKTFERYFFTELLVNLLATVSVLSLVIVGRLLSRLLEKIAKGDYPLDVIRDLLFYGTVDALIFLLPFSAMIAAMLTLGRHYRDSEIYAAFSFGIGYVPICHVLMRCAVPIAILLFVLVMEVSPAGERRYELIEKTSKQRGDVTMVTAGKFFSPRKDTVIFIEDYNRGSNEVSNIFIAKLSGNQTVIETATLGKQKIGNDGIKRLHLYDGHRYEGRPGQSNYQVSDYQEHAIFLPTSLPPVLGDDSEEMTFSELFASPRDEDKAELQWRLVTVVSLPVLMLLAFPLSRVAPRRGRNIQIAGAIVAFVIYECLIILIVDQIGDGNLPVLPGVWLVPIVFFIMTVLMLMHRRIKYALHFSSGNER